MAQSIIFNLMGPSRGAFSCVYELAGFIVTNAIDVFDPHRVPEQYLFFDFFERSISAAVCPQHAVYVLITSNINIDLRTTRS